MSKRTKDKKEEDTKELKTKNNMYSSLWKEKQSTQRYLGKKESSQWDEVCDKNTYFLHSQKNCGMHSEGLLT